jgi:hypothetical protein
MEGWQIWIAPGISFRSKTRLRLSKEEKYFQTLIHEIGHFKITSKPPRKYYSWGEKLKEKYPNNMNVQCYAAEDVIEMGRGESEADYLGKLEDFKNWLVSGRTLAEHHIVERWSIEEFKKQRNRIRKIIKNWKLKKRHLN